MMKTRGSAWAPKKTVPMTRASVAHCRSTSSAPAECGRGARQPHRERHDQQHRRQVGGEDRAAGHDRVAAHEQADRGAGEHRAQRRGEGAGDEEADEVLDGLQPGSLVVVGLAGRQSGSVRQRGGAARAGPLGLGADLRQEPHGQGGLGGVGHREAGRDLQVPTAGQVGQDRGHEDPREGGRLPPTCGEDEGDDRDPGVGPVRRHRAAGCRELHRHLAEDDLGDQEREHADAQEPVAPYAPDPGRC